MPFNHNEIHNGNGNFTHPYVPWDPSLAGPRSPGSGIAPPTGMTVYPGFGWPVQDQLPASGRSFNAVHMTLIPKGPYRGMVLVWNVFPVVAKNPAYAPAQGANVYTSFQPYAIVDPTDTLPAGAVRYRNFLLPMGEYDVTANPPGQDLFCSGHTLTEYGDLVVIGGTDFFATAGVLFSGARVTMVFNGRFPVANYPNTSVNPYPGFFGMWRSAPLLQSKRWYPTATRTMRLPRLANLTYPQGRETILAIGGSYDDGSNNAVDNPTWNKYEALVVNAEATAASSGLDTDQVLNPVTSTVEKEWFGPGSYVGGVPQVDVDWFEEYPRCHTIASGEIAMSGYSPRWATMWHEFPGVWTVSNGQPPGSTIYSSNWQQVRHDGSSVLLPSFSGGPPTDTVLRLGGSNEHWYSTQPVASTDTVEALQVGAGNAWQAVPPMPSTHAPGSQLDGRRFLANAVLLPTGGVLVVGGLHRDANSPPLGGGAFGTPVLKPQVFENGAWTTWDANGGGTLPSIRDYHSTAVLLPDGRVLIAGGERRNYDYEIWSPPYLYKPQFCPQNVSWVAPAPPIHPNLDAYELQYGQSYTLQHDPLPVGHGVTKAVLMAPCSVTHHSDMHQRHVAMEASRTRTSNQVRITAPGSEGECPRGLYMLFLVTNWPAVSRAQWVLFR